LQQVGDLFELNVKLRCQKVNSHNPWNYLSTNTGFSSHW